MIPRPSDYIIAVLLSLGQAAIIAIILNRGLAKRWPYLLILCWFDLLHNVLQFHFTGLENYKTYFYIYWVGHAIRAFLTLGLLRDITRAMPTLKYVPKRIGLVLLVAAVTITVGANFLATQHYPHTFPLIAKILMIKQCVALTWVCLLVMILLSISALGMGWDCATLKITPGFIALGLSAMLASALISSSPEHGEKIDRIQSCIEIAVLFFWSVSLSRCSVPDVTLSDPALNAVINELSEE